MKLKDQTILITGGGSGIGLGLAEEFQKLGNQVIVAGRTRSKLEAAAAKGLQVLPVDMTDAASIQAFAAEVVTRYSALNCVIHNAGVSATEKLIGNDNSQTDIRIIETNLLGPILLTNALLPHLLEQKAATIMTVTSGLAHMPLALSPTYCASKAAIHSYTQSLRAQLQGTSIEVQELVPPYVRTWLLGEHQAQDANAMPLEEYIREVMEILQANPPVEEILVKRVLPMREAAYQGPEHYRAMFEQRNRHFLQVRKQEWDAL